MRDNVSILALILLFASAGTAQHSAEFEVASIKPSGPPGGRADAGGGYCHGTDLKPGSYPRLAQPTPLGQCLFTGVYVGYLIHAAYAEELDITPVEERVKGLPHWANDLRFTVSAKAEDPATATQAQLRRMLQALLAERFQLKVHFESKEMQGYGLHVSKSGPRLKETSGETPRIFGAFSGSPDLMLTVGQNASSKGIASTLSSFGIGPVVDRTGLPGRYDFNLKFDREIITAGKAAAARGSAPATEGTAGSGPTLFTALEEQLGLRLVREKVRVRYLVIDSLQKASEN